VNEDFVLNFVFAVQQTCVTLFACGAVVGRVGGNVFIFLSTFHS
jgi:hypothetical protein